jgi:MFS transporter, SP family, sugar:H+ symporter
MFLTYDRLYKSPRWLATHGLLEQAERSLAVCRGLSPNKAKDDFLLKKEIEEIRNSVEYEKEVRSGWLECFNPKHKLLYRTILGMSLQALQQLTGANYFFYYGATIFQSVGIEDSFVTQIILGAVNCFCTVS